MGLTEQESGVRQVREADLKGACYRLNSILSDLSARISVLEAAGQAAQLGAMVCYGLAAERVNRKNLPDGSLYIDTDDTGVYQLRGELWATVIPPA